MSTLFQIAISLQCRPFLGGQNLVRVRIVVAAIFHFMTVTRPISSSLRFQHGAFSRKNICTPEENACTAGWIAICADTKAYPVHEQQQHRTWTSRSHTSNIVPKCLAERVWYTKSRFYFWIFTSVLVGSSPRSFTYISSTATKLGVSKWMFVLPLSS